MTFLFSILFVLIAVLLIGVILIQQPKTSTGLFSGTGQSLLGTSGKTFWTKFTVVLAIVFMGICLLFSTLAKNQPQTSVAEKIEKQQQQQAQALQQQAPVNPPPAGIKPQEKPAPAGGVKPQDNLPPQKAPAMPEKAPEAPAAPKK